MIHGNRWLIPLHNLVLLEYKTCGRHVAIYLPDFVRLQFDLLFGIVPKGLQFARGLLFFCFDRLAQFGFQVFHALFAIGFLLLNCLRQLLGPLKMIRRLDIDVTFHDCFF